MSRLIYVVVLIIIVFVHPSCANAQARYWLVGAAKAMDVNELDKLELPANPVDSGISFSGNEFSLHDSGTVCEVGVKKSGNFEFDSYLAHFFKGPEGMRKFLLDKFHINYDDLRKAYLLGSPRWLGCDALRNSTVYAMNKKFILFNGVWVYVFEWRATPPADTSTHFNCGKAVTNVEHMICSNPALLELDATMNRGFVEQQFAESKEISYEDPVRKDQLNWLKNVRNRCATVICLSKAYNSRIQYIKGRISDYDSYYPGRKPDEDVDTIDYD